MEPNGRNRRRSRAGGYGCLTALLLFLAFFVVIPILRGSGHPDIDHDIYEFPGVESDAEISIGLDSDDQGTIHLAWSEAGHGIRYVMSGDGGASWSKALEVSDDSIIVDLFVSGDSIVVASSRRDDITLHRSIDGGGSWSDPRRLVSRIKRMDVDFLRDGRHLYFAFPQDGFIHLMHSEDFGQTWSQSTPIANVDGWVRNWTLELTRSDRALFVFWVQRQFAGSTRADDRSSGTRDSRPILLQSNDRARTWMPREDLTDVFREVSQPQYGYGGTAVATSDNVFIFFGTASGGLFGVYRSEAGGSWSSPRGFYGQRSSDGRIATASSANQVFLGIVGARYREYQPIGYVWLPPFYSMFGWRNNDLNLIVADADSGWRDTLITPAASRVARTWKASTRRLLLSKGNLYIFWTGRRKVGRRLDTFGYKEQIFWVKFDLESLY